MISKALFKNWPLKFIGKVCKRETIYFSLFFELGYIIMEVKHAVKKSHSQHFALHPSLSSMVLNGELKEIKSRFLLLLNSDRFINLM